LRIPDIKRTSAGRLVMKNRFECVGTIVLRYNASKKILSGMFYDINLEMSTAELRKKRQELVHSESKLYDTI